MAPIAVKKRPSARAKASRMPKPTTSASSSIPTKTFPSDSLFPSSKKDKRSIKHSSFVHKIEKSSSKSTKRRRPNKKLIANLESLADALPGLEDGGEGNVEIGQAHIQRKSLKSRPGAMKKKAKLERMEKERFNANLAQMAVSGSTDAASSIADRWAALKNHVRSTAMQECVHTDKVHENGR